MSVSWQPPEPRPGLAGAWDRFMGPGATRSELLLELLATIGGALFLVAYVWLAQPDWSAGQLVVALILMADLAGGVVTNATSTAKRWYHREGQTIRDHLGFVAVHFLHPLLVAWLFRDGDWLYFAITYGYLMLAAWVISAVPLYLRRPLAMALYLAALLLALYAFAPTPGLEWFLPFYYLKLLVSHLLPEAPFRPAVEPLSRS